MSTGDPLTPLSSLCIIFTFRKTGSLCLAFTHIYYNPEDPISLVSAWLALVPMAILVVYATLCWSRREIEFFFVVGGQLVCEGLNWGLKRLVKEKRPPPMIGKGYGMPSSHSQFMTYIAVYFSLWILAKFESNKEWSPSRKFVDISLAIASAVVVCLSRIYLNYHTTKQVAAGAIIGALVGWTWYTCVQAARSSGLVDVILSHPIANMLFIKDTIHYRDTLKEEWIEFQRFRRLEKPKNLQA